MGLSYRNLDPYPVGGQKTVEVYDMIESRVEFEDSTFQLFTTPEDLKLLNVDPQSKFEFALPPEDNSPFTMWF